eukprot:5597870-Pyramimonas_sp.AAC.2
MPTCAEPIVTQGPCRPWRYYTLRPDGGAGEGAYILSPVPRLMPATAAAQWTGCGRDPPQSSQH